MAKTEFQMLLCLGFLCFSWARSASELSCFRWYHLDADLCDSCAGDIETEAVHDPQHFTPRKSDLLRELRAIEEQLEDSKNRYMELLRNQTYENLSDQDINAEEQYSYFAKGTDVMKIQHYLTQISRHMALTYTSMARKYHLEVPEWNEIYLRRASCLAQQITRRTSCNLQLAAIRTRTGVPETFCRQSFSIEKPQSRGNFAGVMLNFIRRSHQRVREAIKLANSA